VLVERRDKNQEINQDTSMALRSVRVTWSTFSPWNIVHGEKFAEKVALRSTFTFFRHLLKWRKITHSSETDGHILIYGRKAWQKCAPDLRTTRSTAMHGVKCGLKVKFVSTLRLKSRMVYLNLSAHWNFIFGCR